MTEFSPLIAAISAPWTALAVGALVLFAAVIAVSNRIRRRVLGSTAHWLGAWASADDDSAWLAARALADARECDDVVDGLVWVTTRITRSGPVTLFLRTADGCSYKPLRSNLMSSPPEDVMADDPLAQILRKSPSVHYFNGRGDDLENAPIHVVNGTQVSDCQAACAIPLRHGNLLAGFILCGWRSHSGVPSLGAMSRVERLARCFSALMPEWAGELATFQQSIESVGLSHPPEKTRTSRAEDRIQWGLEPAAALYFSQDAETHASVRVEQSEPQASGIRGGYDTSD
jgi:hypothetical protein